MRIMTIDPGTTESAYARMSITNGFIDLGHTAKIENERLVNRINADALVIEMIKSYGNAMGDTTIETCVWIGRFIQTFKTLNPGGKLFLIPRKTIVTELCKNPKAKDSNVRQAVIDYFRAFTSDDLLGAGKEPMIGTNKKPGPLYEVSKDMWSAIAVGIAWHEIEKRKHDDLERILG